MAIRNWAGAAPRVAQVQTYAFGGTWEVGDIIRVKFGRKTWDYAVTSTAIATFLPLFVTAFNALSSSDYPEFAEVTASSDSTTLTLTADSAGKPFVCSLTPLETGGGAADAQTIEGGGTETTGTTATACSSPNHWGIAANWMEGAVPVTGDDAIINQGPSILYDLDQSGVTLASLTIGLGFPESADIGLSENTSPQSPASGYPQYLDQRLTIGATVCTIETRSRRIRLDLTPDPTTVTVRSTGQPATSTERALDLVADDAGGSTVIYLQKANVGLNALPGDTGTVSDVNVSFRDSPSSDVSLLCGADLTLTRLDQGGGEVTLNNGAVTVLKSDGTLMYSAGAITTLTNRGGLVNDDSDGTITTLNNKGRYVRRGFRPKTITNATLYAGGQTDDPNGSITWTNPPEFNECRLAAGPDDRGPDVAFVNFGVHRSLGVFELATLTPVELLAAVQVGSASGSGGAVDCDGRPLRCRAILSAADSTTSSNDTFTARVEESDTGSGGWSTVATFDVCDWDAAASYFQVLNFTRAKRYLRFAYVTTGTPTTVDICIILE